MDAVALARIQFALTVGFHFLFPPISIGLAWLLVGVEWKAWRTGDPGERDLWERAGVFFAKVLALTFAVGVASGIVMEFQFGTNWATYSRFVGDIFGAPLAAEGVFAFFLESGFLGLYLFGRNKVSKGAHWFSILMVAVGATLSAFWIIVANSWQQTPAGYTLNAAAGRAELTSFAEAVFNPSTGHRYLHTVLAALVSGAFFMGGFSALLLLKGRGIEVARRTLGLSVVVGLVASLLLAFPSGHEHARQVARTQPEKFAAIEGIYESHASHAPLVLFALPQTRPPELKAAVEVPGLLSWMTFGDVNAPIKGISELQADCDARCDAGDKVWCGPCTPQGFELWLGFVSFHNMVLLGAWFIGLLGLATFLLWRRRLFDNRLVLRALAWSIPLPLAACQLGWITAEVGRQPFIVHGLLRTKDAASVTVGAGEILVSIVIFSLVYLALGALWIFLLKKKLDVGPDGHPPAGGAGMEVV